MPYTICDELEAFETLEKLPDYNCKNFMNNLFSFILPKWSKKKNVKLLRLPFYHHPSYTFKISPPNPWMIHSGYSDYIFVESKKIKNITQQRYSFSKDFNNWWNC